MKIKNHFKTYIGIDNGVSGTIGALRVSTKSGIVINSFFVNTPIKVEQDYTKKSKNVTRIHYQELYDFLRTFLLKGTKTFCLLERPLVNPKRFVATGSALRALESTLIVLENLKMPYSYIDSKEWQKELLPGLKKGNSKKLSETIGKRLYPNFKVFIEDHGDADGLLIAEYARRQKY